jgi:hypothetical protein
MKSFVGIVFVGLTLVGCGDQELSSPSTGIDVPIVRLRSEPNSFSYFTGIRESTRLIVRDRDTWRATWNKLYDRQSPVPAIPDIDFSKEMVVVAALGERGSGGYSIVFENASENEAGGVNVVVRSTSPGRGCAAPTVMTQPTDLARIPNRYPSIRFIEREEVRTCE